MWPELSVVVPMYNEADNVATFYERTRAVLDGLGLSWEIVCVDDGSRDDTLLQLIALHRRDPRVKVVELARNFGKEIALTAGLDAAGGQAVVPIDADLQDPPELIPTMVERWRQGYDVVFATRTERMGESWLKQQTAATFYRLMERLSEVPIPPNTGDFRLMSRPAVDALRGVRERNRFMKGIFAWVGFRQTQLPYRRDARHAGETKWNWWSLTRLAIEGITSFSSAPLQLATWMGLAVSALAFAYALHRVVITLLRGPDVPGYPSLLVVILFLGGVQLITLGIIGEYIGRIYQEVKQRPLYLVRRRYGQVAEPPFVQTPPLRMTAIDGSVAAVRAADGS
ncbi:MAG: glycosyltransferase family 2 protein [Ardenticatenia bacterium]|nr:glycosyltransferase family 2 protein [Ardenticatenia bacterium]